MGECCEQLGLRLKKGQGYALVISDDGQHHWIPGGMSKVRKEEGDSSTSITPGERAASDGDNKTDNPHSSRTDSGQNKGKPSLGQLKTDH